MPRLRRLWTAGLLTAGLAVSGAAGLVSAGSASAAAAPLVFTTTSLPTAIVGNPYNTAIHHTGGAGQIVISILSVDGRTSYYLPFGLTLGATSGIISGVPVDQGYGARTHTVNFVANDTEAHPQVVYFTLTISETPAVVTTTSVPVGRAGVAYPSTKINRIGCSHWQEQWYVVTHPNVPTEPALPAGMTLSTSGVLSGTPTTPYSNTPVFAFDNSAQVARGGIGSETPLCQGGGYIPLTILPMGITQTEPITASVPVDKAFPAFTEKNAGGKAPFTWTISTGALPAGLKINANSGQITGTPVVPGASSFTIQLADSIGNVATQAETVTVTPMAITTTTLADAHLKKSYSAKLTESGGKAALKWTATSTLPPGIKLSTAGQFSGTPTAAGTYTVTVELTDASKPANTATATLTLTVDPT